MQLSSQSKQRQKSVAVREEVEKRYLAYALSTIVARALPDVRDGLKPVHRRILYAMHSMGLSDAARMRKSAAVVGEVIGKYHPHGDQAAYDALVRMAQDFSLRYPLIEGSGNFGSVDGDSPAAMRYTETRLSAFAGILLREIDQGTTEFRATYDAMGVEPEVLPAGVPNLLVNGSSGIAVGMSCSFPPHNLSDVVTACRAAIADTKLDSLGLLKYIKCPDFPTGGQILDQPGLLAEIYSQGHGSLQVRGTFEVEPQKRGKKQIVITSIPYSVNKSRLIERIAHLVREKRLKQVVDIRDESTNDVRIVLELRGIDVNPESVMAFVYKHTDMQVNFPVNMIAVTGAGVPERLSLEGIIRHFLEFRYEKTTLRLQHRLALLEKRIHVLEGFAALFADLDLALKIIRSAHSRQEAAEGLKSRFKLDDEQVDAILEMRLYRLVAIEKDKLLGELSAKKKDAAEIRRDLASPKRLWKIIDNELAEVARKFGDSRRTALVKPKDVAATEYRPDDFVEHEDVTVILSQQGWLRRIKMEVDDISSLKFREGDGLSGIYRVNTDNTIAFFSNLGKVYVMKALDVPQSSGFGEPLGSLINLVDGEYLVGFIAPDPVLAEKTPKLLDPSEEDSPIEDQDSSAESVQVSLFEEVSKDSKPVIVEILSEELPAEKPPSSRGLLITKLGKGFRFDYNVLREPTKRLGRKLANLIKGDEVLTVLPEEGELTVVASDSGKVLVFPVEQIPVLAGPGQGVKIIKLVNGSQVSYATTCHYEQVIHFQPKKGKGKRFVVNEIPQANRATQGRKVMPSIESAQLLTEIEGDN